MRFQQKLMIKIAKRSVSFVYVLSIAFALISQQNSFGACPATATTLIPNAASGARYLQVSTEVDYMKLSQLFMIKVAEHRTACMQALAFACTLNGFAYSAGDDMGPTSTYKQGYDTVNHLFWAHQGYECAACCVPWPTISNPFAVQTPVPTPTQTPIPLPGSGSMF